MYTRLSILSLVVAAPLLGQDTTAAPVIPPRIALGVTTGTMEFGDQRVQQGVTGVLRYRAFAGISIAASPTFARVAFPSSLGGGSVSGLTDLPVELTADRSFDIPWTPTAGLALGISLPIGDKANGFGSEFRSHFLLYGLLVCWGHCVFNCYLHLSEAF